tara:strand:+ start:296 stop:805 length:510 start_codon:yes stop_codon:yes gene_type:complete
MKLTTRGRFAVTAVLDLAMQHSNKPLKLAEISERQQISLSYLEQLFTKLRQRKIVNSVRGPGGGYCLARKMEHVSVADIILAVNEPIDSTQCGGKENCHNDKKCITHNLWMSLNKLIFGHLSSINLKQLVDEQQMDEISTIKMIDIHQIYSDKELTASLNKTFKNKQEQ